MAVASLTRLACAVLVLAISPIGAQSIPARLIGPTASPAPGDTIQIEVQVDLSGRSESLGAYEATLTWDPAVLALVVAADGSTAVFAGAQTRTAAGTLTFSQFSITGAGGVISLLRPRFRVLGDAGQSTDLTLSLSVLDAARTFTSLLADVQATNLRVRVAGGAVVVGRVRLAATAPAPGDTVTAEVQVDLSTRSESLGAYEATLNWDSAILSLIEVADGSTSAFAGPQTRTEAGRLTFSQFSIGGAGGVVSLIRPRFRVTGTSGQRAALGLSFSVLDAARTFASLLPALVIDTTGASLTVRQGNRPPVLASIGARTVAEGTSLSIVLSGTDPDGDSLSYTASGIPTGARLAGGTFTWTPGFDQAGSYSVTFAVSDGRGLSDNETVAITVTNTNRPPVLASIGSQSVVAGRTLRLNLSASDPDNDPLTYSYTGNAQGVSLAGSTFAWTPSFAQVGSYLLTFSVIDAHGGTDTESVTIQVNHGGGTNVGFTASLTPSNVQVRAIGDTFHVAVSVAGVVSGKQALIRAKYDGTVLAYGGFEVGPLIPGLIAPGASIVAEGGGWYTAEVGGAQLGGTPASGAGVLGQLLFRVTALPESETVVSVTTVQVNASSSDRSELTFAEGVLAVRVVVAQRAAADFNGDGVVGFDDFFLFADAFGQAATGANARFDLDGSRAVDFGDFFLFADEFGKVY